MERFLKTFDPRTNVEEFILNLILFGIVLSIVAMTLIVGSIFESIGSLSWVKLFWLPFGFYNTMVVFRIIKTYRELTIESFFVRWLNAFLFVFSALMFTPDTLLHVLLTSLLSATLLGMVSMIALDVDNRNHENKLRKRK